MDELNFLFNTGFCEKKGVRNSIPKRVYRNFHVTIIVETNPPPSPSLFPVKWLQISTQYISSCWKFIYSSLSLDPDPPKNQKQASRHHMRITSLTSFEWMVFRQELTETYKKENKLVITHWNS